MRSEFPRGPIERRPSWHPAARLSGCFSLKILFPHNCFSHMKVLPHNPTSGHLHWLCPLPKLLVSVVYPIVTCSRKPSVITLSKILPGTKPYNLIVY